MKTMLILSSIFFISCKGTNLTSASSPMTCKQYYISPSSNITIHATSTENIHNFNLKINDENISSDCIKNSQCFKVSTNVKNKLIEISVSDYKITTNHSIIFNYTDSDEHEHQVASYDFNIFKDSQYMIDNCQNVDIDKVTIEE